MSGDLALFIQIIGFVLIFAILIAWFYITKPTPEELEAEKAKQEQIEAAQETEKPQLVKEEVKEKGLNDDMKSMQSGFTLSSQRGVGESPRPVTCLVNQYVNEHNVMQDQ